MTSIRTIADSTADAAGQFVRGDHCETDSPAEVDLAELTAAVTGLHGDWLGTVSTGDRAAHNSNILMVV